MLISSLCAILSFCTLALVWFLLLHKDAVFTLSCIFVTASVSHGTLHFILDLGSMHYAGASMWALTKF